MEINKNFMSIEQVTGQYLSNDKAAQNIKKPSGPSFEEIFKKEAGIGTEKSLTESSILKFSKHAGARLESRNINFSAEQLARLEEGTRRAEEKGINDSLVLVDDMAFIVNVKSNTVVTAMEQGESLERVFTNIDGAVII